MRGGTGNDTYVVDSAGDVVVELAGEGTDTVQSSISYTLGSNVENLTLTGTAKIDGTGNTLANTLTGNAADNVLDGGAGNDRLNGGGGNDTLIGGAGNDRLDGGTGDDTMRGGTGNDTYVVDSAGDVVVELAGEGTDTVQSSISYTLGSNVENLTLTGTGKIDGAGNDLNNTLTGNAADNVLDGGAGNDRLNGGGGNDTLIGGAGNDRLDGGAGDDVLLGGAGNDALIGGTGSDLFVYMSGQGSDVVNGGSGSWTDTIALGGGAGSLQMGTDWTLTLQSGSIVSQNTNELVLSGDADGFISFADGARMDFVDIERIQW
jgi:Ca2+-binding RTX toxin-like protein